MVAAIIYPFPGVGDSSGIADIRALIVAVAYCLRHISIRVVRSERIDL